MGKASLSAITKVASDLWAAYCRYKKSDNVRRAEPGIHRSMGKLAIEARWRSPVSTPGKALCEEGRNIQIRLSNVAQQPVIKDL